jgi:3,4-dihydroxy-9,10-secoandrosta-1,3,5(10)-triene-9,17-dione 4,5-dioxygenase
VELFHGLVTDFVFASPWGAQFLTDPYGLGHALFMVPEMAPSLDFYRSVLGFRRSDFLDMRPAMTVNFLRCTPRHHSVAISHAGPSRVGTMSGIHHVMFEMTTIDHVGRALDRAMQADIEITSSIGRHPNDGMLSFYMRSPAGFEVEIGCDGTLVDEATWAERSFSPGSGWGHHGVSAESIQRSLQR